MDWWVLSPVNDEDAWWDSADGRVLSSGMRRSRYCSTPRRIASNCRGRGPDVEWKKFRVSESVEKGKAGRSGSADGKEVKVTLYCALGKKTPAWCCRDGVSMIGG